MLMRSTEFPFGVILKSILESLIMIYPNLNYYRHSVSIIHIINSGTTLCAQCPERKLELRCCVAIFFLFSNFFMKFTRSF